MPISLPPISRRRFIARSLAASAGVLANRNLFGASQKRDEHCWALFSDIHIAADRSTVRHNTNMTDNFVAVTRELLNLPKRPAGVLISGDLAFSSGQTADYQTVTELLQPLRAAGLPLHLALGNHDERDRFKAVLRKDFKESAAQKQTLLLNAANVNWILLDSLEVTLQTPGSLGEAQRAWLAKTLDTNRKKPAIIVVHHSPDDKGNFGLKDTKALFEIIRPRKQVKALVYGHSHNWNVQQDPSGIHLINLPPTAYVFQEAKPNGWVQANLRKDGMGLELRCLDQKHAQHGQVVDLEWRA